MAKTKAKSSKKSSAEKTTPKKSSKKTAPKKSSGGGGLGPICPKLSKLEREVKSASGVTEGQFNSLKARVSKVEAHAKGQDRALMTLAEHADQTDQSIISLQRSRDDIMRRLGDVGDGGGFRRFKVV